jgi:Tol biopolymer transport system component
LVELKRVVAAPDGAEFHDRVAELTGEVYTTTQVAENAAAPLWSPDGRYLLYTTGVGAQRRIAVRRADAPALDPVFETAGFAPSIGPDNRTLIYSTTGSGTGFQLMALPNGTPGRVTVDAPAIAAAVVVGSNPARVAVIAGAQGDSTARLLVYNIPAGTWSTVNTGGMQPVGFSRSPDGNRLLVLLGERGAFARQIPGFAQQSRNTAMAELSGNALGPVVGGIMPAWSGDGSTFAYVEVGGEIARVCVQRRSGTRVCPMTLEKPFQAPVLSPSGAQLAIPTMLREDWELFVVATADGAQPRRVTREIQHDHSPRFLTDELLLGVMGEGRHQRSYLYDLRSGTRQRFFHNNTVRTVAPEYEWAISPDGTRVAIVSERDGDTVTPHRHLWLSDLRRKVTRQELTARIDRSLADERQLRETGRRMFAPIAAQVRAATAEVSIGRIYDYQKQLFSFDSKHITQPGNWQATEWLERTYRGFGLDTRLQRFRTVAGQELEVANVLATIRGTENPDLVYVVGAHFDSRAEGPGADDNTSGTAMILEAARVLAKRPLPATVMFVAFTGEEAGLRGAREFGRVMKDSITVVGALNNDMMGWSNDHRLDNTIRYSNPGLRDVQHAAAIHFSELITYDAFYYKSTDAQALYDAWGDIIAGIGSYPILGNPHYHQPHDVLETINHRQLTETSRATVATIMYMASAPSRLTGLVAQGGIASWDAAREKGVTRYIVRYGPPNNPMQYSATATTNTATLPTLREGWHVAVKAVNARGLEGWDWARTVVK